METLIRNSQNERRSTLLALTILLLAWGLVRPMYALAADINPINTWTPACDSGETSALACMPQGREGFAASVINNQIIVTHGNKGGCTDSSDTRIYDIPKDTWFDPTPAGSPVARSELAGATDGHLHYAVGGRTFATSDDCNSGGVGDTLEAYDPVKNVWTSLQSMPTARAGLAAVVVGKKLYAIGGRRHNSDPGAVPGTGTATGCLEAYDIDAGQWGPTCGLAPMLQPAMDVAAIADKSKRKIYVIGGSTGGTGFLSSVQIYDVANDTWSAGTGMPTPRANLALAACDRVSPFQSVILALGGRDSAFTLNTVESYEVSTDSWVTHLTGMPTAKSEHGAVSHGGRVYVTGSGPFGSGPGPFNEALKCSSLFDNNKK